MNATQIINDKMSLEEKLRAIDLAMINAVAESQKVTGAGATDPADLTICIGCE